MAEHGDAEGVTRSGSFGAADAPDAVLFKLANFIHMYSCTMQCLTPLDSTSLLVWPLYREIDCTVRSILNGSNITSNRSR